jgi:hypothetical protein
MRGTNDMQHHFYNAKGKEEWHCQFYLQSYVLSGGTGTIKTHLEGYHSIKEDSPTDTRAKNVQIDIEKAMESASKHPHKH